jgi:hypothetical protein
MFLPSCVGSQKHAHLPFPEPDESYPNFRPIHITIIPSTTKSSKQFLSLILLSRHRQKSQKSGRKRDSERRLVCEVKEDKALLFSTGVFCFYLYLPS